MGNNGSLDIALSDRTWQRLELERMCFLFNQPLFAAKRADRDELNSIGWLFLVDFNCEIGKEIERKLPEKERGQVALVVVGQRQQQQKQFLQQGSATRKTRCRCCCHSSHR